MSHKYLNDDAKPSSSADVNIKRNCFDVSKKHFASYGLAKFYPIYTRMLQPNETLKITPMMKLDLDTMAHEIRNRLTAHVEFAKVPIRILWNDFNNWYHTNDIIKPSSIVMPYIERPVVTPGSLLNHLGVPASSHNLNGMMEEQLVYDMKFDTPTIQGTKHLYEMTTVGGYSTAMENDYVPMTALKLADCRFTSMLSIPTPYTKAEFASFSQHPFGTRSARGTLYKGMYGILQEAKRLREETSDSVFATLQQMWATNVPLATDICKVSADAPYNFSVVRTRTNTSTNYAIRLFAFQGECLQESTFLREIRCSYISQLALPERKITLKNGQVVFPPTQFNHAIDDESVDFLNEHRKDGNIFLVGVYPNSANVTSLLAKYLKVNPPMYAAGLTQTDDKWTFAVSPGVCSWSIRYQREQRELINSGEKFTGPMRLNALRLRAYRAWYNATKRDHVLDPFCPAVNPHDPSNDTAAYIDRCVENMDSGADYDTPQDFERCLWDEDMYNSCLPTPSMLNSRPLVGVYSKDGSNDIYAVYKQEGGTAPAEIHLTVDGDRITGISGHNGDPDLLSLSTLADAIKVGISRHDLKCQSALESWYHTQYKHGRYSLRQFVGAHFGTYPSGMAEMFPTVVGRFDIPVQEWEVFNQTASPDAPLGQRAAMATFGGKTKQFTIKADEPCIVLGIIWFSIDNNMTDCLNKSYYVLDRPEMPDPMFCFGTDPITQREIAPLRADENTALDIFGHNRRYAWCLEEHDTIAGEYCSSRSGEIMVRRLADKPLLSPEFRIMNENEVTNIFTNKVDHDHIFGQIWFDAQLITWHPQRPNVFII